MRPLVAIAFISVFALFLFLANLAVYEAIAAVFLIENHSYLALLGFVLGTFSASFVFATIIGLRYLNVFTRTLYIISAVWIGFFSYVFLASAAFGIIALLPVENAAPYGKLMLVSACSASVYGVVRARKVRVRDYEISLPGLSDAWSGRTTVWISDLHLGQLHGTAFARAIVRRVNSMAPDIIFIGGDLFDGICTPELAAPLSSLSAPLGTFYVTGNHEEFGENGIFLEAVSKAGIHALMDEKVEIDGVQLIGVDYHNNADRHTFAGNLSRLNIQTHRPSILLKHEPKDLDVARDAGISLCIAGHTHFAQFWPLTYVARAVYGRFAYGLSTLDTLQVITSSGTGTWGPPMRLGTECEIVRITFK